MTRRAGFALAIILMLAASVVAADDPPRLARGDVTQAIECANAPGQTWDLYLPSSYDPAKKWPVLYCLDARGRGRLPLDRFRDAAERYGWIIVSSNNSASDTSMQVTADAMKAIWIDSRLRLSIDTSRVYVAGFSGTARFAAISDQLLGHVRGVIAAGAGLPYDSPVRKTFPYDYYLTVGRRDFNYYEVHKLERTLLERAATFHVAYFDGTHGWPPSSVAGDAIEWMQLRAMRDGLVPADESFLAKQLEARSAEARRLEQERRLAEAMDAWASILRDFDGLDVDTTAARAHADRLAKDPETVKAIDAATRRDADDLEAIDDAAAILSEAVAPGARRTTPAKLVRRLGIHDLLGRAANERDPLAAESASRILATLAVQTSFYMPAALLKRGDVEHAILLVKVSTEIQPSQAGPWYQLAVYECKADRKREALDALAEAVKRGIRNADAVRGDPDLALIRSEPRFEEILGTIEAKTPQDGIS